MTDLGALAESATPPSSPRSTLPSGVTVALALLLLLLTLISLTIGRYPVPLGEIARVLVTTSPLNAVGHSTDTPWVVVEIVRLPRILLVVLAGMGLGLCGAAMQGVFRNPLVAPEVAGVSSGAAFGGVLAIMLALPTFGVVAAAFAGGMVALVLSFLIAQLGRSAGSLALVLSGVIVGTFFGALVGLMQYLADPRTQLPSIVYWLLGSFADATYDKVRVLGTVVVLAGTALLLLRWRINLLSLGEFDAQALGVSTGTLRWGTVALVALLVAAQVSVSGGVGWVGLVVPHLARMLVGPGHSRLLPASALMGGSYLLAMDDIARSVTAEEIPIGLLTSAVGAPVFVILFWKLGSPGWGRD